MAMQIVIEIPEIATVTVSVTGKYSPDLLDDIKGRATSVLGSAVVAYQIATQHIEYAELNGAEVPVGE